MNSGTRTIVLAGGSGFLGLALARHFSQSGWQVVIFSRGSADAPKTGGIKHLQWDGKTMGAWAEALNGCDAVINLAGRTVNCRFTAQNRKDILESRVNATKVLGEAISRSGKPPAVWLNCSGVGIYNQSFHRDIDESSKDFSEAQTGTSFVGGVALQWERALTDANTPQTRKVALRISMVLGRQKGTPFTILQRLAKFGMAGTLGTGRQFVSWIHKRDFCRALDWIIANPAVSGAVNITAPEPVTNAEFMRTLRRACGAPIGLPAPAWALRIGALFTGTEPDLILDSRRVVPERLMAAGFKFDFPTCASALRDLAARKSKNSQGHPA